MKKQSFAIRLSRKILLITSVIFVVAVLVVGAIGIKVSRDSSLDYAKELLSHAVNEVEAPLRQTEKLVAEVARFVEELHNNNAELDTMSMFRLLEKSVADAPDLLGIGIFYEPYCYTKDSRFAGIYLYNDSENNEYYHEWDSDESYAEDGWDYFELDWYSNARESGESRWISPFMDYMDEGDSILTTTFSCPLRDSEGKIFAVCSADVSLDWVKDRLDQLKPYPRSSIVVADADLRYICNPIADDVTDGSLNDTPFLKDVPVAMNVNSAEELMSMMEKDGSIKVSAKGNVAFCVFGTLSNGWVLGVNSLYADAFKGIFTMLVILAAMTVIGLLVLFFSSRRIIHRESSPISDFAVAASKITGGRFDVPIKETGTQDELEDLGDALRYMQQSVTDYIEKLETTMSEKRRLESELDVARNIQMQMLSKQFPNMEHAGVYASCTPAREVGGDLYDFVISGDSIYFVLGDVSGKGVPAALLMAITIAAFRAIGKKGHDIAEIASRVNNTFCRSNDDLMFVTLVVGKLNLETGHVTFCNAGHNPMVLIDDNGGASFIKCKPNLACGVLEGFRYEEEYFDMKPGYRLLVYSDGITEAEDTVKNQYGEPRLLEWASNCSSTCSDKEAVNSLAESVQEFVAGAEPNDDRTILSLSFPNSRD